MRLTRAFATLAGLLVGVRATSLTSRNPAANPLDTRAVVDVCAFLDVGLTIDLLGIIITVGLLDVCLCLSVVASFVETNSVCQSAVALSSTASVTQTLTNLINENAPKSHCTYPEFGIPACIGTNPCGFTCPDGFVPSPPSNPTECLCPPPSQICNGLCVKDKVCPSSKPHKRDKRWIGSGACNARGEGHMACGVFGGAARAWECIDTYNDLESCGGCNIPLTPYTPVGIDCTAIPGVADVSCQTGECVVRRCETGYTPSPGGTHCIHNGSSRGSHSTSNKDDVEGIPASQYGLEHVPLKV